MVKGFDTDITTFQEFPSRFSGVFEKKKMEETCNGRQTTTKSGAWCLKSRRPPQMIRLNHGSYELPSHHVRADAGIVKFLITLMTAQQTLLDLGCGVGQYGRELIDYNKTWEKRYMGFDGAVNVEDFTGGFVTNANLGIEQNLPVADWVVSLEVGEHIQHSMEDHYIQNLHMSNRKGIILSWGVLHQHGLAHINNHSPQYIMERFRRLGYKYDNTTTLKLRSSASYHWFKRSIYVILSDPLPGYLFSDGVKGRYRPFNPFFESVSERCNHRCNSSYGVVYLEVS